MKTVLFACVHNAGRSQMAAALFNALADPVKARAISAGTEPGERVHPEVVAAMRRSASIFGRATPGSSRTSSRAAPAAHHDGLRRACPVVPGLRREDWPLEDPKGRPANRGVRGFRDEDPRSRAGFSAGT